ncbi:MAG TPA: ABC transporter ATP-binding protein [Tepidisphaeraceae bacterium]|jgi:ABC-type multidrug transport system fused ATPase/permease subunit
MSSDPKPKSKSDQDFRRAVGFLWPYRRLVILTFACAVITGMIMSTGIPAMVPILRILSNGDTLQSWVHGLVTRAGPNAPAYKQIPLGWLSRLADIMPENRVQTVAILFVAIACIAMVGNVVRFCYEYYANKVVIAAVNDIRRKLYDHILHLPLEYFGLKGSSDVTSRLVSDCSVLQEGLNLCLGQSVLDVVRAVFALATAMIIDWRLTLFIIVGMPLMAAVIKKFGKKMRRASRAAMQNNSTMLGQVESSLAGIRVVKASTAERYERRRYTEILDELRAQQMKMARYDAMSTPILETMGMWGAGAMLIYATYLMFGENVKNPLTWVGLAALMVALVAIGESVRKLSKINNVLQRSGAAAARIFEIIDLPLERPRRILPLPGRERKRVPAVSAVEPRIEAAESESASTNGERLVNLTPIQRDVRFESVTYSYPNTSAAAVTDVELVVPKGRSVAIVGRNGSGKTTLLALLPRFYDPELGRITVDGIDIRKATLRSLRRQIGIVTQDSVIFPGSIAENIAFGLPQATRDQIESAARRAFAHDFILEKPKGYDTPLDGLGGQLSGGQKQRLSIARAILRAAPILILDEATSQVDAESEHLIQQAIEALMHERTTFVIAHRLNTVLSADTIVVMDRGRIVGQGKHDELLRSCETYQLLYERQLVTAQA